MKEHFGAGSERTRYNIYTCGASANLRFPAREQRQYGDLAFDDASKSYSLNSLLNGNLYVDVRKGKVHL